jgi:hypothetical protein
LGQLSASTGGGGLSLMSWLLTWGRSWSASVNAIVPVCGSLNVKILQRCASGVDVSLTRGVEDARRPSRSGSFLDTVDLRHRVAWSRRRGRRQHYDLLRKSLGEVSGVAKRQALFESVGYGFEGRSGLKVCVGEDTRGKADRRLVSTS